MIERKRLLSLGYYKKARRFTGNDGHKSYMVEFIEDKEAETKVFKATIWPGPLCFDKTDDSLKKIKETDFTEEGLLELVDWMNATEV